MVLDRLFYLDLYSSDCFVCVPLPQARCHGVGSIVLLGLVLKRLFCLCSTSAGKVPWCWIDCSTWTCTQAIVLFVFCFRRQGAMVLDRGERVGVAEVSHCSN